VSSPTVYVVDDDEAVRDALGMLFRTADLAVDSCASAEQFLQKKDLQRPCCLVLDIRMPGMTGLALQEALVERGVILPILFITGHGDIPMAVEAVKKGAYEFIEKPFDEPHLLEQALKSLEDPTAFGHPRGQPVRKKLDQLSDREREVLECVLAGQPSRQIAEALFISVKTVEFHRARIMQKLGVRSAAELFKYCFQS